MKIVVDADALPNAVKHIIFRAAERMDLELIFVANKNIRMPNKHNFSMITVGKSPDEADDHIVEIMIAGDLVITADIPLADRVVSEKGYVINPRGDLYNEANIKSKLATRNLMDQLRNEGIIEGGPAAFSTKNVQNFANQLDRFLSKKNR